MNVKDICRLMESFEKSGLAELKYQSWNTTLELKKNCVSSACTVSGPAGAKAGVSQNAVSDGSSDKVTADRASGSDAAAVSDNEVSKEDGSAVGNEGPGSEEKKDDIREVTSPLAGVFYRAPEPDAEPFVKEGSRIRKGDTIGLIEAMKMISEVPAPCDGTVTEILAENGKFAEFKSVLLRVSVS